MVGPPPISANTAALSFKKTKSVMIGCLPIHDLTLFGSLEILIHRPIDTTRPMNTPPSTKPPIIVAMITAVKQSPGKSHFFTCSFISNPFEFKLIPFVFSCQVRCPFLWHLTILWSTNEHRCYFLISISSEATTNPCDNKFKFWIFTCI